MRHGTSSPARALLAAALACALAPLAATAASAGVRQVGPVKVGNKDNTFVPKDITAAPDAKGEITIEFTSTGSHTIQSNDVPGFDSDIVTDAKKTITFKAPAAGQYKVICELHESVGMVGTLTVSGDAAPSESATAEPTSEPTVSASATAEPEETAAPGEEGDEAAAEGEVPGVAGNKVLEEIEEAREGQAGAVSGFKFFTFVTIAFIVILGAAVLFSTRPRRAGR